MQPEVPILDAQREVAPDYTGGGIANLMSSLIQGLGGSSALPGAHVLTPEQVAGFRTVVLLVIDGLGAEFLAARANSFLHRHTRARLTSVFPSTTASAITTYMSGLTPLEHGLTGWFTYLREIGSVATVLPFRPRSGGPTYAQLGVEARQIFRWTPLFDRVEADSVVVSPEFIVDSDYSRANGGRASRMGYRGLDGMLATVRDAVAGAGARRYVYAYWPELDSICHQHGTASAAAEEQFRALDHACESLCRDLRGTDTLLLVCADHGHIDTSPAHTLHLENHPDLQAALRLPLCGEPRVAFCYVAPDAALGFERYVQEHLQEQCRLLTRADLLRRGWLGPGTAHPLLHTRLGDYVLLMRDDWVIRERLLGEQPPVQVGVHGGTSLAEMLVPLAVMSG